MDQRAAAQLANLNKRLGAEKALRLTLAGLFSKLERNGGGLGCGARAQLEFVE